MQREKQRVRRTQEQLIADLEARISGLRARAEQKKARRDPTLRHMSAALRSIDKAMAESGDAATRRALDEARATISACLALNGVVVAGATGQRGRRSSEHVQDMAETLLAHVQKHPGQRSEEIAEALKTDTSTMRLPMRKLIDGKQVKTRGQRRGTTYFPV